MSFLLKIESLLPRKTSHALQKKLGFSGEAHEARRKVGFILAYPFFIGLIVAAAVAIWFGRTDTFTLVVGYVSGVLLSFAVIYLLIDFQSMSRARKIEDRLPDALELVAVNISAGLTVENSLVESARPEFGELALFLKKAAKEVFSGEAVEHAFRGISDRVDSEILRRSVILINEGMKKGASLGELLLRISSDLRSESSLKKEIGSNISMYVMLIVIATAFGAPILFGAGSVVASSFSKQNTSIPQVSALGANSMPFLSFMTSSQKTGNEFAISDIETVSVVSLVLTCLFASLIIGIIKYNKEKAGLRYFPALLIIALIVFYVGTFVLRKTFFGA